jgi:hypothetical protein
MLRVPLVTPRSGRFLIAVLLGVKLALLVWNAAVFDGKPYDVGHHSDRALFGGLRPGKMAYNPPPYYFPALLLKRPADVPLVERSSETIGEDEEAVQSRRERSTHATRAERSFREKLITLLRYTNIFWVGLFYLTWIYYSFPRLLRGFQPWFLASLLLLVLPGYQKLGVMSHPDNMFAGAAAAAIAIWLDIRERWQPRPAAASAEPRLALSHLVGFAVAIGLMALTRPFAAVPTAVLSVVCAVYVLRSARGSLLRQLSRLLLVGTIIGVMSVSWYAYRWKKSGEVTNAYRTGYISKFEKRRANFDYRSYYTTLNLHDLIIDPSRKMGDGEGVYADTPLANSFFTLLYSEIWGDQWLYFSGPKMQDNKVWPKRMLLACALAVPPTMFVLGLMSLWALIGRVRKMAQEASPQPLLQRLRLLLAAFEPELVLLSIALLGAGLFVYWQGGPALLPGKNSTVKFIYIATLFPPAIALVFTRRLRPVVFNLLSGYFLVLFVVAYPVAMYWPK